jgi:hypothetical protein
MVSRRITPALVRALAFLRGLVKVRRRPLSSRGYYLLLGAHALTSVAWIVVLAIAVVTDPGLVVRPVDPHAAASLSVLRTMLTVWVLAPCVFVALATGARLASAYAPPRPRWLRAKVILTLAVLATGGVVLAGLAPGADVVLAARISSLVALGVVLVLSVVRPGARRTARISLVAPIPDRPRTRGGKGQHRK